MSTEAAGIAAPAGARGSRGGDAGAKIADQIRAGILAGDHPPGTRLRQEDIAERYGASRVPVREALRMLEYEGLVRMIANTGAWVATLTLAECEEIYQMRERLEPLLLQMSAPSLTAADLEQLQSLAGEMASSDDVETFLELDRAFHLGSYAQAQTSQLGELVVKLWNTTQPYRRAYSRGMDADARRIAHDEHHLILTALLDGDAEEAGRYLAGHIRRTRRQLARHPDLFDTISSWN